jgi:hypothetical protein
LQPPDTTTTLNIDTTTTIAAAVVTAVAVAIAIDLAGVKAVPFLRMTHAPWNDLSS